MTAIRTADATAEPVSFADARRHCRVLNNDDDGYIASLVKTARQHCENVCGRAFVRQQWQKSTGCFVDSIFLPTLNLLEVTEVNYFDVNGALQIVSPSDYEVDLISAQIFPGTGKAWPSTQSRPNAVTIKYFAGFGATANDVPEPIKQAILLLVGHWYENREAVLVAATSKPIEFAVDALLTPYRVY